MKYRTIVADPPWRYDDRLSFKWRRGRPSGEGKAFLDYPSLTVAEIAALPVAAMADDDAHLYLWTTQRYLWDAPDVIRAWGFEPSSVVTWCKAPTGFSLGGAWGKSSEFVIFAVARSPRRRARTATGTKGRAADTPRSRRRS